MKQARPKSMFLPILSNLAIIFLGVCLVLWADRVTSFISITIGGVFLLYAIYIMVGYFRAETKTTTPLFTALGLSIAGLFLVLQNDFLKELVSFIVGAFVIIFGIIRLQNALNSREKYAGYRKAVVFAVVEIICGVLCFIGKIIVPDVFLQLIGVMLILAGISDIVGSVLVHYAANHVEAVAIEAEIVEKPQTKKTPAKKKSTKSAKKAKKS